jgi:type VI secretion system protein ImpL
MSVAPSPASGDPARVPAAAAAEPEAGLTGPLADAIALMTRSHRFAVTGDPLYAVPWYLVFGDGGGEARGLLAAGCHDSPFPPPERQPEAAAGWHWWITEELAAAELAPVLFCRPEDRPAWARLEAALGLLVRHRRRLPFNGLALVLNAAMVIRHGAGMAAAGQRLRRIADEAERTIGLGVPVYVLVTGLDALPGHNPVFAALPREAGDQAIGHRFDPERPADAPGELAAFFAGFRERLLRLRIGILGHGEPPADPLGLFRFPEEFAALRPGLTALAGALTVPDGTLLPARLRAVYFTAPGAAAAHATDVFKRFLPADAPLARAS